MPRASMMFATLAQAISNTRKNAIATGVDASDELGVDRDRGSALDERDAGDALSRHAVVRFDTQPVREPRLGGIDGRAWMNSSDDEHALDRAIRQQRSESVRWQRSS